MAIIIDADVVIRGEKGSFDLRRWLASRPDELFEVSAITVAELWHGVEPANTAHRARRERYIRAFLDRVSFVPYTDATAYEHARIWAELESSGTMIGMYDLIVAATALERASTVATFNKRHFQNVRALRLLEPK
jgi:tRNA(fMet)-specific endonuclease VapC